MPGRPDIRFGLALLLPTWPTYTYSRDDMIVVAAIGLPGDLVTTLAIDVDRLYLAMPAVARSGVLTAWEPEGMDAPPPPIDEGPMDKMHRLGRWLASHHLRAPSDFDQYAKA